MIYDLQEKVNEVFTTGTDINEHIPALVKYGQECEHITEMGVRGIQSTWAFLGSSPKHLRSYDIQDPKEWDQDIQNVYDTAEAYGIDFTFTLANVLEVEIEETDLLFLDTWHSYKQLKAELALHADKTKKYIIFHDTTSFENIDEESYEMWGDEWKAEGIGIWKAIEEFLVTNDHWVLEKRFTNNNGLTIIKRV
tara:strand:- start:1136 stop:1717 length:582 start_codon:yes stop_codon:yes gene_type:complete